MFFFIALMSQVFLILPISRTKILFPSLNVKYSGFSYLFSPQGHRKLNKVPAKEFEGFDGTSRVRNVAHFVTKKVLGCRIQITAVKSFTCTPIFGDSQVLVQLDCYDHHNMMTMITKTYNVVPRPKLKIMAVCSASRVDPGK